MTAAILIVSNMLSLLIGWLLGRTGRNAAVSAAAVEDEDDNTDKKPLGRKKFGLFQFMVVGVMVISGVTALNGVIVATNQTKLTDCVSGQFDILIDALDARSNSQREATQQLTEVFRDVVEAYRSPSPDSAKNVRESIEKYVGLRAAADERLRENPYPEPPRNACADLR